MANAILIPQFEPDLSGFALKEHTHDQYLTSHQSLTNYATKTFVANQIAAIDFPDAGVLTFNGRSGAVEPKSGDYTADMVGAAPKSHSHSGYASSTHNHDDAYAAKTHTHSQYLTAHQSLEDYAKKTWVEEQLEGGRGIKTFSFPFTIGGYSSRFPVLDVPESILSVNITEITLADPWYHQISDSQGRLSFVTGTQEYDIISYPTSATGATTYIYQVWQLLCSIGLKTSGGTSTGYNLGIRPYGRQIMFCIYQSSSDQYGYYGDTMKATIKGTIKY